jgi:heme/copper-type cytochrome/quinol oxidase subunit 1
MRIVSTDHKVIGLQYLFTSLTFLVAGFLFILLIRWQLAYPGQPIPLIGAWLADSMAPGGKMLPEFYNQLTAMHGTTMVFLGVVPFAVGAFGNYLIPRFLGSMLSATGCISRVGWSCSRDSSCPAAPPVRAGRLILRSPTSRPLARRRGLRACC